MCGDDETEDDGWSWFAFFSLKDHQSYALWNMFSVDTQEISCCWWEFCSRKIAEVSQISRCVESIHYSSKDRDFPSRHTRYILGHTHCCLILELFHHSLVFAQGAREHTQVVEVFLVFARGAKEHTQVLQVFLVFTRGAKEHTQGLQIFLVFSRGAKEHTQGLQVFLVVAWGAKEHTQSWQLFLVFAQGAREHT